MLFRSIYGKQFGIRTHFGSWDDDFTMEELEKFIIAFYSKLRKGGTLIMFFDIWKIGDLKVLMEKKRFKQIRFIEWIKNNPPPINSSRNYLANCREVALLAVKDKNPTFNSKYDNGVYRYPIVSFKKSTHPTKKNQQFFEELIRKHSNENDVVMDTFLGSGTTFFACKNTNRIFIGCEREKIYYDEILNRIDT